MSIGVDNFFSHADNFPLIFLHFFSPAAIHFDTIEQNAILQRLLKLLVSNATLCYFIIMKLFMLILFPAVALFFTNGFSRDVLFPNKHAACFLAFLGLILGALFCTIDWIFFLPVHFAVYNYVTEFLSLLIPETVIPFLLCFVPFVIFFRESFAYKLRTFAYILFGFYAVQLPYFLIQRYDVLPPFLLFLRPVLQLGMCFSAYALFSLVKQSASGKSITMSVVAFPLFLIMYCVPTFIETTWFLGADAQIWVTLSIVYVFLSFLAFPILARATSKAAPARQVQEQE